MATKPSLLENWFANSLHEPTSSTTSEQQLTLGLVTVVIPSYARQDFLLRQCVYWHSSGARVVIVDGSPEPLGPSLLQALEALDDITYLHANISMMERLRLACGHISTPYAILHGDDEFLLYSGLCEAIETLQRDSALVACIGQSLAFHPEPDGSCTYGPGYPHWQYAVRQAHANQRLQSALSNYTAATCYAVIRTPIWRKSWGQLENWSSPYVGEMQQGITTYIWGKLTTVDDVYWMRSDENAPVTNKNFNRGVTFTDWWASPRFASEHERFLALLCRELEEAGGMTAQAARSVVLEAVNTFLRHLDAINADAQKAHGLRGRLRRVLALSLKRLLPDRWQATIKSAIFGAGNLAGSGRYGRLKELADLKSNQKFAMNPRLLDDLSRMESLIGTFYRFKPIQAR